MQVQILEPFEMWVMSLVKEYSVEEENQYTANRNRINRNTSYSYWGN